MKQLFNISILLLFGLFLCNCKKDKENIPTKTFKNIVTLTSDYKILEVSNYIGETLYYKKKFVYSDNLVDVIQTDCNNIITFKTKYYLNSAGLADSSIESSNGNSSSLETIIHFKYDNTRHKIEEEFNAQTQYKTVFLYKILNENCESKTINIYDKYNTLNFQQKIADYEYSTQENKIDIFSFIGDFNGKRNLNLIKSEIHYESSPHSSSPASSEYTYLLDSKGLVIQIDEFFTSSHRTNENPSHENRITKFIYNFQ